MGQVNKPILDIAAERAGELHRENMSKEWMGKIVDVNDPKMLGRCKIRVFEKFDGITDEYLPWAYPAQSTTFSGGGGKGSFSFPSVGTIVRVTFQDGDWSAPEYTTIENMTDTTKENLVKNSAVVLQNEESSTRIAHTPGANKGLEFGNKGSRIMLSNEGDLSLLQAKGSSALTMIDSDVILSSKSRIQIQSLKIALETDDCRCGSGAAHPAVKGDDLMTMLLAMLTYIDARFGGVPVLVPMLQMADILSNKVYVA